MAKAQTQPPTSSPRKRRPTKADLEAELAALRQQVDELQRENSQLEGALASTAEQAEAIAETLQQEKEDLETRFEKAALKRLGGSIAFVSKKKVKWDADE